MTNQPSSPVSKKNKSQPKGFVMLIIAAVLTALVALVLAQTQVSVSDRRTTATVDRDSHARAIAESCLQRMLSHARAYSMNPGVRDLDGLLDPDNIPNNGNEFLPSFGVAGEATVQVPPTGVGVMYQYRLIPMDGGACLARYDDNADDYGNLSSGVVTSSNQQAGFEDTGEDEPRLDTDRSVILTTIGIYPYNTAPANAYERATARVTLRGVLISELEGTSDQPTIWLTEDLDVTGNPSDDNNERKFHVCGTGGVNAREHVGFRDRCVCGPQILDDPDPYYGDCTGDNECDDPRTGPNNTGWLCASTSTVSPDPTPMLLSDPSPPELLTYAANNMANLPQRFSWAIDTGSTWGWDGATNAKNWGTSAGTAGPPLAFWGQFVVAPPTDPPAPVTNRFPFWPDGSAGATGAPGELGSTICSFYFRSAANPIAAPYKGYANVSLRAENTVFFWDYTDANPYVNLSTNFSPGPNTTQVMEANPGPNTSFNHDCTDYNPSAGMANMAPEPCDWGDFSGDGAQRRITCTAQQSLCWKPVAILDDFQSGAADFMSSGVLEASFPAGPGTNPEYFSLKNNGSSDTVPYTNPAATFQTLCGNVTDQNGDEGWDFATGLWRFAENAVEHNDWPDRGVYFVIDNDPRTNGTRVRIEEDVGTNSDLLRAAFLARGSIDFEKEVNLICPTCSNAGTNMNSNAESCALDPGNSPDKSDGFVMMAGGHCELSDDGERHRIVGDALCRTILSDTDDNHSCWLGDLLTFGGPVGEVCNNGCNNGTYGHAPTLNIYSGPGDDYCRHGFMGDDDPGVCLHRHWGVAGMVVAGDLIIEEDNFFGGPAIIHYDDVYMDEENYFRAHFRGVPTAASVGSVRVTLDGRENVIDGRVYGQNMSVRDRHNLIHWEGGTQQTEVSEQFIWMDTTW